MKEQYTVRIGDIKLINKLNKVKGQLKGIYPTQNPFIVDCIKRGVEIIEREQLGIRNINSLNELYEEIHKTYEKLETLIKISENSAKESIANLEVNKKLLSCNYNMLLGLSDDNPKNKDMVEHGLYDDLPERFEDFLQEVLDVVLKKQ